MQAPWATSRLPMTADSGPSETASDLGAPLRNRTVDLLLTMHNSAGSLPGGGAAGGNIQRAGYCRGPPWGRKVRLRDLGCARRAEIKGAGMFRSVPGRSVRPGASRSRPGRRSDDGHVILLRVQLGLERPVQQVFLDCQANLNPLPSPCFRTTSSHEDNPANLQPQRGCHRQGVAPNATMLWRAYAGDQP